MWVFHLKSTLNTVDTVQYHSATAQYYRTRVQYDTYAVCLLSTVALLYPRILYPGIEGETVSGAPHYTIYSSQSDV